MVANTIAMRLYLTYLSIYGRRSYDVGLHRRYGKILRTLRTALFMGISPQCLGDYNEGCYIIMNRAGFSIKVPMRKYIYLQGALETDWFDVDRPRRVHRRVMVRGYSLC